MRIPRPLLLVIAVALLFSVKGLPQQDTFEEARRCQVKGDFATAERSYRKFLTNHPNSVPALTNLGVVLAREGKFHPAIVEYHSALTIDPESMPALINLGLSYYRLGDWKNAAGSFEKVQIGRAHV